MNKVKQVLLSTNFIVAVFVLIGVRIAISGASIGDALAIIGICGLIGLNNWTQTTKDIATINTTNTNADLKQEVEDIKNHMTALMIKNSVRPTITPIQNTEPKKFF